MEDLDLPGFFSTKVILRLLPLFALNTSAALLPENCISLSQ